MEKKFIPFRISNIPFLLVSMGPPSPEGMVPKAPGVSFPADCLKYYVEKLNQQMRKYTNGGAHVLPSPVGCVSFRDVCISVTLLAWCLVKKKKKKKLPGRVERISYLESLR